METPATSSLLAVQPPILTAENSELSGCHQALETRGAVIHGESHLAQLAPEVLLLIINYLGLTDKARLLATCQYLRQLVEPFLYLHLDPDDSWKSRRRIHLFKTLDERQSLLPCIRTFRGLLIPTSISRPNQEVEPIKSEDLLEIPPWPDKAAQNEWLAITVPLLGRAVNIQDLEIEDRIHWESNGIWELFKSVVSSMKLRRLALACTLDEALDFTPILRAQPELLRLELQCPYAILEGLEKTDVPNLESFKGTLRQAATIVPGRPVRLLDLTCIFWILGSCHCLNDETYQKLLLSSNTITKFKIHSHTAFGNISIRDLVQIVAQYMPKLADFAIVVGGPISAQMLLEEIPKFSSLCNLMLLETWLEFLEGPSSDLRSPGVHDWESLEEQLKELCPSLTDVGFTYYSRPMCGNAMMQLHLSRKDYL